MAVEVSTLPLEPFVYLVCGFAAYRAARFIALDSLTAGLREWVTLWSRTKTKRADGRRVFYRGDASGPWWKEKPVQLMLCGYCNGWWLSGLAYLAAVDVTSSWSSYPLLAHFLSWWAVGGVEAVLMRFDAGPPDE